jgi:ElaB/YqjD/DUF883 family membrane-anchored ribosome-binding protein
MSLSEQDVKEGRINDGLENQLESLSAQVEAGIEQGRNKIADWRAVAGEKTRECTEALNTMAQEKPWQLVAGATAIGLILGLLFSKRR